MRSSRLAAAIAVLLLAGCAAEQRRPPAPVAPSPPPVPAPAPPMDWRDLPLTPGSWRYAAEPGVSAASFGVAGAPPTLTLRCVPAARTVTIVRAGAAAALTIRTSYAERTVAAAATGATLAATDPLLDQIAFSRGRFSVAAPGLPLLVMPAWAEPGRVIEDCRG